MYSKVKKKLDECAGCGSCKDHEKDKPTKWEPWVETRLPRAEGVNKHRDCFCSCRHDARVLCRYHPDCKTPQGQQPDLGEKVLDILEDTMTSLEYQTWWAEGMPVSASSLPKQDDLSAKL